MVLKTLKFELGPVVDGAKKHKAAKAQEQPAIQSQSAAERMLATTERLYELQASMQTNWIGDELNTQLMNDKWAM